MKSRRHAFVCFVAMGVALAASGCAAEGGTGAKAAAPPEPTTVEEAQAQLDDARQQIEGTLGPAAPASAAGAAGGGTAVPPATVAPVAPADMPAAPQASVQSAAPLESEQGARTDSCATPCRAIASMRRAVDAICRMAGAQDAGCAKARKTLSDDEARVAPCGC
jgi:hypothetical protein